eukprot:jgi/Bigna1/137682/aug1.40_g12390
MEHAAVRHLSEERARMYKAIQQRLRASTVLMETSIENKLRSGAAAPAAECFSGGVRGVDKTRPPGAPRGDLLGDLKVLVERMQRDSDSVLQKAEMSIRQIDRALNEN